MKKVLYALFYLPMPILGIYCGIYFSIPGDSDTIPFASMLIGIILVALPMLVLSILNIIMFIINIRFSTIGNKKTRILTLIEGMVTPALVFLWLIFITSNFIVNIVTGIYFFISLILGTVLLISDAKHS